MGEIVAILKGKEAQALARKKKALLPLNNNTNVSDAYPELMQTKSEMNNHFALAMLGVEFDDDDHLYRR